MKVAIIGAGLSGLACAYGLKIHGIEPVIFEKKGFLGKDYYFSTTTLRIFDRSFLSPIELLRRKYGLKISPFSPLKEITMVSDRRSTTVSGNLGFCFKRGEEQNSIEKQLAAMVNLPIQFNSYVDIDEVRYNFDYIIAATGEESIPKRLDIWTPVFNAHIRVATVLGNFKIDSAKMWVNTRYSKNCYCYLTPNSSKDARILMVVNGITHNELDFYWKEFLCKEKITYVITETKDTEYTLGTVTSAAVGNVYLAGHAAGVIDDFLGFGSINAIESGLLAAHAIVHRLDYNRLIKPLLDNVKRIHEFRETINSFENRDYDILLTLLGFPVIKQFIYNNPFFKAAGLYPLIKSVNCIKRKNR